MSTASWRAEKSSLVVRSICSLLSSIDTSRPVREELRIALWDALKLYAEAIEELAKNTNTRWSPGVVRLFTDHPEQCGQWLDLMAEEDFSSADYWKTDE